MQTKKRNAFASKKAVAVYEWAGTLVLAMVILVVLFTFFVRVIRVDGDSMDNTLRDGDQLLLYTNVTEYQRGDIVVVDRYTVAPLVKRIIAVGGDTIKIDDNGMVYLNGMMLSEPYVKGETTPKDCVETVIVPSGYVFVMGDNRVDSHDSRSSEIGLVSVKDIVGKAVYRLSPLSSFGEIYNNLEYSIG